MKQPVTDISEGVLSVPTGLLIDRPSAARLQHILHDWDPFHPDMCVKLAYSRRRAAARRVDVVVALGRTFQC